MKSQKQRKLFYESMTQPIEYLDYLHWDLGGSYFTTRRGNQYNLSIRDSIIRAFYAKRIKNKAQTFEIFQKFFCQAKRQSRKKLKHLRTDFGREFANQAFKGYTAGESIKWKLSAPYIPEPNGKVERLNYTLMFTVQSIMSAIYLLKTLQDEPIKTVIYLKNQSPGINSIIHYQLSNHVCPNVSHLNVI